MYRRVRTDPFLSEQDDHDPTSEDYLPESPSAAASPPKKSRRGVQKRVVSVPIGDVEGSKGKGEAYPPSDSWAWRKYGQKPIKGSPYPRGYYRCSSSKGCPARKQVERSRVDPTMLVITYAFDHNHQLPATKSHHHSSAAITAVDSPPRSSTPSSSTSSADQNNTTSTTSLSPAKPQPDDTTVFTPELELGGDSPFKSFLGDFGWLADVAAYDRIIEGPIYAAGNEMFDDVDNLMVLSGRGGDDEDESLFADLEELPEGSVIFGRRAVRPDEPNRRCSNSVWNY